MHVSLAVTTCHEVALAVITWLGYGLLFGTILAGVTWLLIRLSGRGIPYALETLLWSAVLVKFVLPIGPADPFSLNSLFAGLPVSLDAQHVLTPDETASGEIPQPRAAAAARPRLSDPCQKALPQTGQWPTLAGMAYLLCAAGLLTRRAFNHRIFLGRCRALPQAGRAVQSVAISVCRELGVHRIPSVRISKDVPSSFVTGLFSPILVLTHDQLVRRDELESVILHEVAHLRRSDMIVRYLQWIAGSLLFFWPVVAWVNRRIDLVREYACDEWALRQGKLSAGEYARCLLNAMQPMHSGCLSAQATSLAANKSSMERRIDMILKFPGPSARPGRGRVLGLSTLLLWGAVALTGAVGATSEGQAYDGNWPATVESVTEHATKVYKSVAQIDVADCNGDRELTYVEKDTYLVALAMLEPDAFMKEFPYADRNQSGRLDYLEAYGVIRGITLIAYADRRPNAINEQELTLAFYHMALGAQQWLLDNVASEPAVDDLDNIWSIIMRVGGHGRNDHHRKLDHGAPQGSLKALERFRGDTRRFQELESNIAGVRAKLAVETDPHNAAQLRVMLAKLEDLLRILRAE